MSILNRRTFIGTAGALSLVRPTMAFTNRSTPSAFKIGVASYSLRKFSRADAIGILKKLGVSCVSIKSFHLPYEGSADETRKGSQEFRDAGLEVLSGGNIDLKDPAKLRDMFQYAKTAGLPMMVCAPSHDTLDEVEKLAIEFDIKIAIHNHGPEDKHFPSPKTVLDAIEGRDRRMGLCLDIGHTSRTGADIVESAEEAGPRLFDVHVKDLTDMLYSDSQVAVGQGKMPIVSLFRQLRQMNYQGGVMLEYEIFPDEPLPGMIESIAYMRGVVDGLTM